MINFAVLPDVEWASRPGASCLPVGTLRTPLPAFQGTGMPATGTPTVAAYAVSHVRNKVTFVTPPQAPVVESQLGQTNNHNYMTRVVAVGEGAPGPTSRPPDWEPA